MNIKDNLTVTEEDKGERIDLFLACHRPEISRSMWKRLILEGRVLVDGKPVKSSYKLHGNEFISYTIPPPRKLEILPEAIPIEILYQDEDILVLKLHNYDVKQLKGMEDLHRLRKGKIRIVFAKHKKQGVIVDIAFRKDIYKH